MKFIILFPLLIPYLILCFILPLIKFGKIKKGKGVKIYIAKDLIHSDFIFLSKDVEDLFPTDKKYIKIGWGDRKIFLETKTWNDLKIKDFIFAFFGLNHTVLRTEFLENLPKCKSIEISIEQLEIIKNYIKKSYNGKIIQKKESYYQNGDYYESNLNYNCILTCNNWINQALRNAKISNIFWCPITYWI